MIVGHLISLLLTHEFYLFETVAGHLWYLHHWRTNCSYLNWLQGNFGVSITDLTQIEMVVEHLWYLSIATVSLRVPR
jgi:hypothetical protein